MKRAGCIIFTALVLTGCVTAPNLETGEGCWRYRVVEGVVVRSPSTDITYLNLDEIEEICPKPPPNKVVLACYVRSDPVLGEHKIYMYWGAGNVSLLEEKCHSIMQGQAHNNCTGYSFGKDASACDWDQPSVKTNEKT